MKYKILFLNPVFRKGLNITVRKEKKWINAKMGDFLSIKKTTENKEIARGKISEKAYLPFGLIPSKWLAFEHDSACHTKEGLFLEMKRAYPNFTDRDYVTVIFFEILEESEISLEKK